MQEVRLNDDAINLICNAFRNNFLQNDHLWLFGSRVDLSKRGGDIDIYIETSLSPLEKVMTAKNKFYVQLIKQLGDQKIDIIVNHTRDTEKLIYNIAKTEGVRLV